MSTPSVPPRPQRTPAPHTAVKHDMPSIPPRPLRKTDPSPQREEYTRSPLNGPPVALGSKQQLRPRPSQDLPRRPPSVSLPDIGHEGDEYSSFDQLPDEAHGVVVAPRAGEQTKNVPSDLPMHQPRASLPQSSAKKQIAGVTGTDSTQAAAAGIGRSRPADDVHKLPLGDTGTSSPLTRAATTGQESARPPSADHPLRTTASFNRSTSSFQLAERSSSRPASVYGDDREHGIPEIGVQVPLLHMAGDVQAPGLLATSSQHTPGIGFFNDGSTRAHHRKRSSRQEFGVPDMYGLHHGQQDQFEKEWVRKHPEEAAKEGHYLHLHKPLTALTSEQLNKLVHQEEPGTPGTPDEYTEDELLERVVSNQPSPAFADHKRHGSAGSHPPDSPFRKPFAQARLHPDDAIEADDAHIAPRKNSRAFEDEHEHEHRDGTPILASDELLKRPSSAYMHAAVERDLDSYYDEHYDSDTGRRNSAQGTSRPSSRPSSVHGTAGLQGYHGGSLHRFVSHEELHYSGMGTPLEDVEEYEPLFPENEADGPKRAFKKRPELAQHHFPSQDIWEDTPASLQYSAEVSTPDLERTQESLQAPTDAKTSVFETPEQELKRRAENDLTNNMNSDSKTFIKPHFKAGVLQDMHRPSPHRFPSSDIWEDSPDSVRLETTVGSDVDESRGGEDTRPIVPTRPQRQSGLAREVQSMDNSTENEQPVSSDQTRAPTVPAKFSLPPRPVRASKPDQVDGAGETVKSKPPVPARPGGEKIASLKAGFMSDLNNRLKLGPQPPKREPEPEAEEEAKAPLLDARKSRARGPARRKPATSPAADRKSSIGFAFSPLIHCWSIDEADELQVHDGDEADEAQESTVVGPEVENALAANELRNIDSAAPTEDIAAHISKTWQPGEAAAKHRGSEPELKAALAKLGAAPATYAETFEEPAERQTGEVQDTGVQTGEVEMTSTLPSDQQEKLTGHPDAKAPEEGNAIVKDGEEVQS